MTKTVVKLVPEKKPPRPTKMAIAKLKEDPTLAGDFDAKFGAGAAAVHLNQTAELTELMRDLIEIQGELCDKIAELVDLMKAPRQAIYDADGNVAGAVPMTRYRLDEDANTWVCNQCEKPQGKCSCDDAGDYELIKA